jgi:hypothetical protein
MRLLSEAVNKLFKRPSGPAIFLHLTWISERKSGAKKRAAHLIDDTALLLFFIFKSRGLHPSFPGNRQRA